MARLLELITNDDGRVSRTQCLILAMFFLSVCLTVAHVVRGDVLSTPVLFILVFLHVFSLLDRMNARHVNLSVNRDGAHISLGSDCSEEKDT